MGYYDYTPPHIMLPPQPPPPPQYTYNCYGYGSCSPNVQPQPTQQYGPQRSPPQSFYNPYYGGMRRYR
ncbi:hypothetical protein M413DRAFT_440677 [Hebeloma cylindrosporum]|uniref:Uncharacterized protein n=1 Tax=Hebeloma cylindrosporum TaxID=76867 RepID=A0A0C3CTI5_HEBCY|nr:hypothetical protein M413DRAFT_440677 [Hebeloma cylindrosporum h7]